MSKEYSTAIQSAARILDAWLPRKIQYERVPGLSVGIVHNGKLVYQRGFGYADVEAKIAATPQTCYRIASISKTFTAVAIMQLVESGKIALDDRVEKHLPWFKAKAKAADSQYVTIRQILSHTGGVFRDGDTPHWENDAFPDSIQLRRSISGNTAVFESLTRFKYSNFGFALLGEIIQKVSGIDYEEYVTKSILRKLGMRRTAADLSRESEKWLAKGYARPIPDRRREVFRHCATRAYAPATGFVSNVVDLARYLSALTLKRKDAALLGRESKKEMMRAFWATGETGDSYGLGFSIHKIEKRKVVGHAGGFAGFITQVSLDVENDIGVVTLTNTIDDAAGSINTGIFETIYSLVDEKRKYYHGKHLAGAEKYQGLYHSRWNDVVVAGIGAGLVAFDPQTNSPLKTGTLLKPNGKHTFLLETKSEFDSPGESASFVFDKNSRKAKRLMWASSPCERLGRL